PLVRAGNLQNIAWIYESEGEDARVLEYAHRVMALAGRIGDKTEIADAYETIAGVEARRGHYAQSLAAHTKSLALLEQIGHRRETVNTLANMGEVLQQLRRPAEAVAKLQRAVDIGDSVGIPKVTADA